MRKEFLKIAGVENEKDFYKLFPTEAAFFGMYPEAKKLVQKKKDGQLQQFRPGGYFATTFTTTASTLINTTPPPPESLEVKTNPESGFQTWGDYTYFPDQGWTKNLNDVIVTSTRPKQQGLNGEFRYDGPTMDVEFDDQGNPRYVTRPGELRFERNQDKFENQNVWQYNTPSAVADRQRMDEIRRTGPQLNQAQEERPWYSKALAVITHPATAFGYSVRNQRMPDYFERGNVNPTDRALQVVAALAGARGLGLTPGAIGTGLTTTIGGIPGLTVGNALTAYGATDFALNRATQIPGQIRRGEYADAATNLGFGALDLMGLGAGNPSLYKNAYNASRNVLNKSGQYLTGARNIGSSSAPVLSDYANIEQLRLAGKFKNFQQANFDQPNLYANAETFNRIKAESNQLLKKYTKEYKNKFGVTGSVNQNDVLLYGAYQDLLQNQNINKSFLNESNTLAKDLGLSTDLTAAEKFLGDAYQLEFSSHFNKDLGPFSNYIKEPFQNVILKNKVQNPIQVKRTSPFNRQVRVIRNGKEDNIFYDDLQIDDIIYPEHNWSTTTGLNEDIWGSGSSLNTTARINVPKGQSVFIPNMYQGSVYPNELELLLPNKLGYKVSGINKEAVGETPRFIFDIHNPYKKGGQIWNNKKYGGLVKAGDGLEYTGPSLVDYLATKGYKGTKAFRKDLAQQYGVENYDYSANKNLELLGKLRENQEILNQQQRSFEPVSVETIEQLHAKNKAGLDRHSSLPRKREAQYQFDADKFNALLNLNTYAIDAAANMRSGLKTTPSLSFKNAPTYHQIQKQQQQKQQQESTPVLKKVGLSEEGDDEFNNHLEYSRNILNPTGFNHPTSFPKYGPIDPSQIKQQRQGEYEGEYDLPEKNKEESISWMDVINPLKWESMQGSVGFLEDLYQLGTNYFSRKKALKEGDDPTKTKSTIALPTVTPNKTSTTNPYSLTLPGVSFAQGNPIDMTDKNSRYYTKPLWLDLNSPTLKLGARNRGSQLGDIKTEGFVITPFAKEYGTGYDDDGGKNTIRTYNDSEIVDDKIYGGVDNQGKFYLDYGKNLKGKGLQMSDFRSMDISGIAKNKTGKYVYGDATSNKKVARTAIALDEKGQPTQDLNLLVPKKRINTGHESFGQIGGGRFILATTDLKNKVLVAGSLKNIDDYVEEFKKATGQKVIKLIPLDNGTFARGLFTKDGVITNDDQNTYDNFNTSGGAAFYIQNKKRGGSILSRMDLGGTPPNCDPGYMPDPNDPSKCIQDPAFWAKFSPNSSEALAADQGMDQMFNNQFPTTQTTTTWVQWYNQNLANSVIDPPKDIYGNPMSMEWQGDPTYDPSKKTDMYGNVITTTTTKPPNYLFGNVGKFFDKKAPFIMATAKALNTGFALGNRLSAEKEYRDFQKSYEKNLRNKIFTQPVMPSVSGSRGDYVTNTGAFRPNEYTVNKGMYTSNMPGAKVGTQQFAQFGAEIIPQALEAPPVEFSPIVLPEKVNVVPETTSTSDDVNYDASNLPSAGQYVLPLAEWDVTSGFGRRKAPKEGASTDHNGIDLKAKVNSPVYSPFDGTVSKIYYDGKGGKQLVIKHDDGTRSGYAHLNDYKVNVGDKITKGQLVALTGNTGNSTGPHLHFTFRDANGNLVDPNSIFGNYNKPSNNVKKSPGETIAVTHNNPGNIHYGDFVKQWGATKGSLDAGSTGNVAIFKTIDDGWDAFNKLLFGSAYKDLTLIQARNKWVTGNPNNTTPSSSSIVKEMGLDGNIKVSDLSAEQKKKYSSLFVKNEDKNMYKKMKDLKLFEVGGEVFYNEGEEYDLTEDEIRQILENGGDLEFI